MVLFPLSGTQATNSAGIKPAAIDYGHKMDFNQQSPIKMKTKTHILFEDPDSRLWSYGQAQNLTLSEVDQIKKLLPRTDDIIEIVWTDPQIETTQK